MCFKYQQSVPMSIQYNRGINNIIVIPLSLSSPQQLLKCHGFCVHPLYTDNKCIAGQYDSRCPAVYNVFDRPFFVNLQWHPSNRDFYLEIIPRVDRGDFDSKRSDKPDRI